MFNPCDLAFTRTPKAPNLNGAGELTLETRPDTGSPTPALDRRQPGQPKVALPVTDAPILATPNPLVAAAGELEPRRGRAELEGENALPAVAQKVLDLLARNSSALDSALAAFAEKPLAPERVMRPTGGRVGRGAIGDDLGPERGARPRRPALPPRATAPTRPKEEVRPPVAPVPVEREKLEVLSGPPALKPLESVLREALEADWAAEEGEHLRQQAPAVPILRVQVALRQLNELEAFVGGELRMASDRTFQGFPVTHRQGFRRLAGLAVSQQAGPVGAYLAELHEVYLGYKADYYGLVRARRTMLDRWDPTSLEPVVSEEEITDYLWGKYGEAFEGLLWRLVRTSDRDLEGLAMPLGSDRPWHSGGEEPSFELVQPGVYVALSSDDGDFELQKEQGNPWSAQGVFNLAVAVRLGGDVIAYDGRSGVLKLNGRVIPWSPGIYELPEGARLELGDERLELLSRQGDTVRVAIQGRTLVLSGTVSGDRPVHSVAGALGAFQEGLVNAWRTRDGREVATVPELLDSWKPRPGEALL